MPSSACKKKKQTEIVSASPRKSTRTELCNTSTVRLPMIYVFHSRPSMVAFFFFFTDTATTEIYTLSPTRRSSDRVELELDEQLFEFVFVRQPELEAVQLDRKSTRLNSSHGSNSYAVLCLKKKKLKEATFSQGAGDMAGSVKIVMQNVIQNRDSMTIWIDRTAMLYRLAVFFFTC